MITRRDVRVWLTVLVAAAGASVSLPEPTYAQDGQKKVLVLYSTGRDAAISLAGERELPRLLDRGLERRLDYHSEYIDAGRFSDPAYQAGLRDFLRLKYGSQSLDVVVAVLDVAVTFLEKYRDELFPGTPVVFFSHRPLPRRLPNSTGAVNQLDFGRTMALATTLQPEVEEVFVITGAGARDELLERQARAQLAAFEPRVRVTYLSGLPTPALEQRLASLPPRSIVYYVLVYQDGSGANFQPVDYLDRIQPHSVRPIYSWVDSTIGHGVVGGSMQRLDDQIATVASLALRVLAGESADAIPLVAFDGHINQIDWRELQRWGIDDSRIPAGTAIRFRPTGLWAQYKRYIVGTIVVLLAQTALIAGLLVQASRRRRAEAQLRRSQADLLRSTERIHDLGRRLLTAQETERSRIARELHDDVSQQMALLSVDLQLLASAAHDPETGRQADEALGRLDSIARTVHDLSHRLHPAKLRLIGLIPALSGIQRELSRPGFTVAFSHRDVPAALPHDLTLCLFRVVQEALQNAAKHSGARTVTMDLRGGPASLTLTIVDDGTGFDVDAVWGQGLGLVSMSERLESVGGTLTIRSQPGEGTRLEIVAPVAGVVAAAGAAI